MVGLFQYNNGVGRKVMAQWRGGAVARWRGGAVARWRGGAMARWRDGASFGPSTNISRVRIM